MLHLFLGATPPIITHSDKTDNTAIILLIIGVLLAVSSVIGLIYGIASTVSASKENQKLTTEQNTEQNKDAEVSGEAAVPKKGHPVLIVISLILAVVGILMTAKAISLQNSSSLSSSSSSSTSSSSSSPQTTPKLFTRDARNSDITVQESSLNWRKLGQDVVFVANADVKGLVLMFRFCDSDGAVVTTKTKNIGSVTKGRQYTVSFSITDFSLSENFKIASFYTYVTGGTVSYFS